MALKTQHVVVDYMYLYFRYTFMLNSGKLPRLTLDRDMGDDAGEGFDISQVYYSLRDVERFRKQAEADGYDVTMSVCFDSWTKRKEEGTGYKENRKNIFDESDDVRRNMVREIMRKVGYNVYKIHGLEADDIIYNLVRDNRGMFDSTVIYTPDMDLCVNVKDDVFIRRYSTSMRAEKAIEINLRNYEDMVSNFMKCRVPYNAIMLAKSLIGDTSDHIKGIKRFGPASFNNLLNGPLCRDWNPVIWDVLGKPENTARAIEILHERGAFSDEQFEQARASFELVKPIIVSKGEIKEPFFKSSQAKREEVFREYGMPSLI